MPTQQEIDHFLRKTRGNLYRGLSRRRNKRKDSLMPQHYTDDIPGPHMFDDLAHSPFHMAASSVDDIITSQILQKRFLANKDVELERIYLLTDVRTVRKFIAALKEPKRVFSMSEDHGYVFFADDCYWEYGADSNMVRVKFVGGKDFVGSWSKKLSEEFTIAKSFVEWMYTSDGNSATVPITDEKQPLPEMYPFLSKDLFEYYDDYMDSSASVLVLLGPPGTGKTSFIRGLLQYTKTNALVSYDASILEKDYIFARFVEGQNNVMILEDADTFLGSRTEGNDVMHKFLNVGDGLITSKGKKMIFSTNLPSIKDIDPALIRPGRCFDVLEFRAMQETEHQVLADKLGIDRMTGEKTLAELFHSQIHAPKVKRRNMGFY
jgi:hypothetical protein